MIFSPFNRKKRVDQKVLLGRSRIFCSFRAVDHYIIINKQRNGCFVENRWKITITMANLTELGKKSPTL
jgi:hypothetical protein